MDVKVGIRQETRRTGLRSSHATDKPQRVMRAGDPRPACLYRSGPWGPLLQHGSPWSPRPRLSPVPNGAGCFTGQFKLVPRLCLLGQLCLQGGGKLSWCNETLLDGVKRTWFRVINYLWAAPSSQLSYHGPWRYNVVLRMYSSLFPVLINIYKEKPNQGVLNWF